MKNKQIGPSIREISLQIRNRVNELVNNKVNGVTHMNARILHILRSEEEKGNELCQKDLETIFTISKSTMCEMLNCMERRQYIIRVASRDDSRKNVIKLTELGRKIDDEVGVVIRDYENSLEEKITPEEKDILLNIFEKLKEDK